MLKQAVRKGITASQWSAVIRGGGPCMHIAARYRKNAKPKCSSKLGHFGFFVFSCREEGIRTLDTLLAYTHFPGVRLRPLGHLSITG